MTTDYTLEAQESLGGFVKKAGKNFLTVRTTNVYEQPISLKITPNDLAEFYATASGSIGTLAGLMANRGLSENWHLLQWDGSSM